MMALSRSMAMSCLVLAIVCLLTGCASQAPAPVIDRVATIPKAADSQAGATTAQGSGAGDGAVAPPGYYTVKKGDTLISIGLEHGQSYRDLAAWNNLDNPNKIQVGQQLRVKMAEPEATAPVAVAKPITVPSTVETRPLAGSPASVADGEMLKREPKGGKQPYSEEALARLQKPEAASVIEIRPAVTETPVDRPPPTLAGDGALEWAWPTNGKLIMSFGEANSKGIDIAGKTGDPVLAASSGKVILVSNALPGYGNFVIVKHNAAYLSVYAHNSRILVKEEQMVTKGQKIAEIGASHADQSKLHFEIRHQGKPVDPMKFLPAR